MAHELIQVIASCGIHDDVPPSTLAPFEAATQAGCDRTETDFRRPAEGVIVFHDSHAGGRPLSALTRREIRDATGIRPPAVDDFTECCRGRLSVDCAP